MADLVLRPAGPASGPAERQMAAVASIAVASATWWAAAAVLLPPGGSAVPLVVLGGFLAAGATAAARRRSVSVLPPGKDVLVLTAATCGVLLGLYVMDWLSRDQIGQVARLLPVAVVGFSIFWPEPKVLRFCLLLALGTLLGAPAPSPPALVLALAAMAIALVATNRLTAAATPRLGGAAPVRPRRLGAEAAAVLVIVGLLAALAASLVPPPPGSGGGGGDPRARLPQPAAPAVHFADRLDVSGARGKPGDEYVLLVGAPEPDVWRALTYDRWDGEVWSRSPEERFYVDYEIEPGVGDPEADPATSGLFQSVTILARFADVLAAAPRPTRASAIDTDLEQGADGSVYPVRPLSRGNRYIAISDRTPASAADLRALGDTPARVLPLDVGYFYLQLPNVSPRIRALAAELAVGEPTTFDKARAVETWIDAKTTVTDDAAPVPAGADALETFLLDDRAGPPERAATAMVVMLRA
ncbi:MAG TPA: transglutaminaseTgpA domain-containing protein, partial [Acidimicrobiales bacterium]